MSDGKISSFLSEKWKRKRMVPHEAIRPVQCCKVSLVFFPPLLQLSLPFPPSGYVETNFLKAQRTQFPSTHSSHFSLTQPTTPTKKLLLFRLVPCRRKYKKYILSPIRKMARTQAWNVAPHKLYPISSPTPFKISQNRTKMRSIIRERNFQASHKFSSNKYFSVSFQ